MRPESNNEPGASAALLIGDMQRDFMSGGALPVPGADALSPAINHYVAAFERAGRPIYFSRDWHPADHCSFVSRGGRWPAHCVAGTAGAEFVRDVRVPEDAVILSKATEREHEAYSAFEGTALARQLRAHGITEVWIAGVATEFCVRATALDALEAGFGVTILLDAIRPIQESAGAAVLEELWAAGARGHSWPRSGRHVARSRALSRNPPP